MPSKLVTDRQKSASMVVASERDNEERIAQKLSAWMGLQPEVTRTFLRASANKLETSVAFMIAADQAHELELGDDEPERFARNQAADDLQRGLVSLRDTLTAAFGEEATRKLGFDGRTPVDPVQLHRLGGKIATQLAAWAPPEQSLLEGYIFRKESWVQKLGGPLARLGSALSSVDQEKREGEASLVAKNRAIAESDRAYMLTASLLSAMLEAVGEPELALRVRPPKRRPSQSSAADAPAPESETQPTPTNG